MSEDNVIIIPDVHGRTFWKDAIRGRENERIIFLGDYLDPYSSYEGILPEQAWGRFMEIIDLKKEHPNNVTLLLGNHDMGYLDTDICTARHDWENHQDIKRILRDNIELFDICVVEKIGGMDVLFIHAGVHKRWVAKYSELFKNGEFNAEEMNAMLHDASSRRMLYRCLSDTSKHRGGYDPVGSPIWADIDEFRFCDESLDNMYQVVGHTIQYDGCPMRYGNVICVDCMKAYELSSDNFKSFFKIPE